MLVLLDRESNSLIMLAVHISILRNGVRLKSDMDEIRVSVPIGGLQIGHVFPFIDDNCKKSSFGMFSQIAPLADPSHK